MSSTLSILVSLPNDAPLTSLFTKVESDFSQKHAGQAIKCKTLLIEDCFEIVDVAQSQVQAYLTDMMHVTILATAATASAKSSEQKKEKKQIVEAPAQVEKPKESPKKKEKAAPKKKVEVETRALKKHKLSSSVSMSSDQASQEECATSVKVDKKTSKQASISSVESDLSVKKAETPIKRQKISADETGSDKSKAKTLVQVVTPLKKPSADDTAVVIEDSAAKGESKNQRRKRQRKEQNKLSNQQ